MKCDSDSDSDSNGCSVTAIVSMWKWHLDNDSTNDSNLDSDSDNDSNLDSDNDNDSDNDSYSDNDILTVTMTVIMAVLMTVTVIMTDNESEHFDSDSSKWSIVRLVHQNMSKRHQFENWDYYKVLYGRWAERASLARSPYKTL